MGAPLEEPGYCYSLEAEEPYFQLAECLLAAQAQVQQPLALQVCEVETKFQGHRTVTCNPPSSGL